MAHPLFRRKPIADIMHDKTDAEAHKHGLSRVLNVRDLTFFGIAAIIGAGSFSSLGSAVFTGGARGGGIGYYLWDSLCLYGFLLCRVCQSHSGGRQCLYLCLCVFRGAVCLGDRMGAHYGIFHWKYLRGFFLE